MRHIHMMVFVHSSEPAGLPGDLGQPYRAVPGMGLPFGPASPVGMDWACCCEALPCGAGALCMQSVCGESRYLAVLPDTKEIHCSTLRFLTEIKFWWVLYNKKELLPTAKNRNTCPPCLVSRLLTGCTFQYCVALSGMSLLVATSLPFPAGWAGSLSVSGGADGCESRDISPAEGQRVPEPVDEGQLEGKQK